MLGPAGRVEEHGCELPWLFLFLGKNGSQISWDLTSVRPALHLPIPPCCFLGLWGSCSPAQIGFKRRREQSLHFLPEVCQIFLLLLLSLLDQWEQLTSRLKFLISSSWFYPQLKSIPFPFATTSWPQLAPAPGSCQCQDNMSPWDLGQKARSQQRCTWSKMSVTISDLSPTTPKMSSGLSPHVLFISLTAQSLLEWLAPASVQLF